MIRKGGEKYMKLFLSAITALMLAFSVGGQQIKPKGEIKAKENVTVQSQTHAVDQEKKKDTAVSTSVTETSKTKVETQSSIQDDKEDDSITLYLPKVKTEESNNLKLSGDLDVELEND